jgi:cobalt-zinc-cadmium efflux system outer membrane protein
MQNKIFLFFFLISLKTLAIGDTLSLSIGQADKMFIATNYQLLAASLNINAQKAQELQAKLYPNPILTVDFNAIDSENNQFLHVGNGGQQSVQIEQLILLGGKRKAQIELAKTNTQLAELAFSDLLRQLKFQLHTGMFLLSQKQVLIKKYDKQLTQLEQIMSSYEIQVQKGNIPLKDMVRLKGVYLNLNNDRAALFYDYFDQLSKLQILLQSKSIIQPVISETDFNQFILPLKLDELISLSLANRPDYLMVQKDIKFAEQYFSYQQKLAKPDITLISSYDQRGGAFQRQINIGFALPLMFWNKNQGNISTAKIQIEAKNAVLNGLKSQVESEVQSNFLQYQQTVKEFKKNIKMYNDDFEVTLKGMTENFQKGNIGIIEFVDFFESYNNALSEISRIKIQLASSLEQIKLSTAQDNL